MYVIHHSPAEPTGAEGEQRLALTDPAQGITRFAAWLHTLAPGARTLPLRHQGERAVLVLDGSGKLLVDGAPQRFQSPCTLVVPPGTEHELVNQGATPMQFVVIHADTGMALLHGPPATAALAPSADVPASTDRNTGALF
jgi:quercetin dioxygenase-like cupin family protein